MHSEPYPAETLRARLERDLRAITELLRDPHLDDLVWEQLPNGEWTYLRPETDQRYTLTDHGRASIKQA